jgi:hypothetical protein
MVLHPLGIWYSNTATPPIPTYTNNIIIGMCFSHAVLILRMDTLPSCARSGSKTTKHPTCAKNAQQFIAAGYDPCTKGMDKTVLPSDQMM